MSCYDNNLDGAGFEQLGGPLYLLSQCRPRLLLRIWSTALWWTELGSTVYKLEMKTKCVGGESAVRPVKLFISAVVDTQRYISHFNFMDGWKSVWLLCNVICEKKKKVQIYGLTGWTNPSCTVGNVGSRYWQRRRVCWIKKLCNLWFCWSLTLLC